MSVVDKLLSLTDCACSDVANSNIDVKTKDWWAVEILQMLETYLGQVLSK